MRFMQHIAFVVTYYSIIKFSYINNQEQHSHHELHETTTPTTTTTTTHISHSSSQEVAPSDTHTFVALLDIMYTDSSKRTCTGSIIHDNVVITAAHCFGKKNEEPALELALSFVVLGTKRMFETGYEQYLPIEKIVTHPQFAGWTADLALVYTFAGMTSDKPGEIIPLAGAKSANLNPIDSNVIVITWGRNVEEPNQRRYLQNEPQQKNIFRQKQKQIFQQKMDHDRNVPRRPQTNLFVREKTEEQIQQENVKPISRYLTSAEFEEGEKTERVYGHYGYNITRNVPKYIERFSLNEQTTKKTKNSIFQKHYLTLTSQEKEEVSRFRTQYTDWRREMGEQKNKILVKEFGFVNIQACKKLIEKAKPPPYQIKDGTDVICYSSEDHYITDYDSGAPVIRRGSLVAVTVGDAEFDGDHVGVGMRMSCFCSWIAMNLPGGGDHLNCCKTCCSIKHKNERRDLAIDYNI